MALINSASLSITLSVFRQSGAEIRYDWTRLRPSVRESHP